MKKIFFGLFGLALMSFTAAGVSANVFTLKQTVTLTDGSCVEMYYSRDNGTYSCFTEADLTKYNKINLNSVADTDFEVCLAPKGKIVYQTESLMDGIKMANKLIK